MPKDKKNPFKPVKPGKKKALNREYCQLSTEKDGQYWLYQRSKHRYEQINRYFEDLDVHLAGRVRYGTIVQAGAYIGIYPIRFAEKFDFVHSFEADKYNYELARRNVAASKVSSKIQLHNAALGNEEGRFTLVEVKSTVSHYMSRTPGNIQQVTIDSLNLEDCSLIQLDIEGAELPALKGAQATLQKFNPVVVLEMKGHGTIKGFGYTDDELSAWLLERGYHRVAKSHSDVIFIKQ